MLHFASTKGFGKSHPQQVSRINTLAAKACGDMILSIMSDELMRWHPLR